MLDGWLRCALALAKSLWSHLTSLQHRLSTSLPKLKKGCCLSIDAIHVGHARIRRCTGMLPAVRPVKDFLGSLLSLGTFVDDRDENKCDSKEIYLHKLFSCASFRKKFHEFAFIEDYFRVGGQAHRRPRRHIRYLCLLSFRHVCSFGCTCCENLDLMYLRRRALWYQQKVSAQESLSLHRHDNDTIV